MRIPTPVLWRSVRIENLRWWCGVNSQSLWMLSIVHQASLILNPIKECKTCVSIQVCVYVCIFVCVYECVNFAGVCPISILPSRTLSDPIYVWIFTETSHIYFYWCKVWIKVPFMSHIHTHTHAYTHTNACTLSNQLYVRRIMYNFQRFPSSTANRATCLCQSSVSISIVTHTHTHTRTHTPTLHTF